MGVDSDAKRISPLGGSGPLFGPPRGIEGQWDE